MGGFTLIELLIVMAVLGSLATVVLFLVNPNEQFDKSRDSGRISAIVQISKSLQEYQVSRSNYPEEIDWDTELVRMGMLSSFPSEIRQGDTTYCTDGSNINQYCYQVETISDYNDHAVVYVQLYAKRQKEKCLYQSDTVPYFAYTTFTQETGVVCGEPSVGIKLSFF